MRARARVSPLRTAPGRGECSSSGSCTTFLDSPLILVSAFLEMPSLPPPPQSLRLSAPPHGGGCSGAQGGEGWSEGGKPGSPPALASRVTASAETCPPAALQLPSTPASHASVERRAAAGGEKGGLDEWGQ